MSLGSALAAFVLVVRVYDSYGLPVDDLHAAQTEAQSLLREAGIDVKWTPCSLTADISPFCGQPLGSNELVLRIQAGGVIPVDRVRSMGSSFVNQRTHTAPVLSTVYPDRVSWVARRAGVDDRPVLGRAITHEIGHLLLNTRRHARSGLMRATWSATELRRNGDADWMFLNTEAETLRAAVAARTAESTCGQRDLASADCRGASRR